MAQPSTKSTSTQPVAAVAAHDEWHLLDARGKVLGRLATEAASLLLGKHRPDAQPHILPPVHVVIINTDHVVLTGRKEHAKQYRRYTGYPGGLRERTARDQRERDSRRLLSAAISGMLPKNRLRDQRLKRLMLYRGNEHPHQVQLSNSKA